MGRLDARDPNPMRGKPRSPATAAKTSLLLPARRQVRVRQRPVLQQRRAQVVSCAISLDSPLSFAQDQRADRRGQLDRPLLGASVPQELHGRWCASPSRSTFDQGADGGTQVATLRIRLQVSQAGRRLLAWWLLRMNSQRGTPPRSASSLPARRPSSPSGP